MTLQDMEKGRKVNKPSLPELNDSSCPCNKINTAVVVQEEKILEVGNDLQILPGVVNQCLLNVDYKFGDVDLLKIGLYEIMVNSIEYGNLEITSSNKQELLGNGQNYYEYLLSRSNLPEFAKRYLHIRVSLHTNRLSITIEDNGPGFPWQDMLIKGYSLPEDPYSFCGRGIFLAIKVFDELRFNEQGNSIELIKFAKDAHSDAETTDTLTRRTT